MPAYIVQPPFETFTDIDGQPLEAGFVWLGVANLDPQENPIAAFWDEALTIPAPQPLRTSGGYIFNSGTPARIFVGANSYSIRVMNKSGSQLYTLTNATSIDPNASGIEYMPAGTGAVATTVQSKLRESVSVFDFMTDAQRLDVSSGTGAISISAAWQSAVDYCRDNVCKTVTMPPGAYLHTVPLNMTTAARNGISFIGLGGRRSGVTIKCSTGAWAVELVGSAWTKWSGIYFTKGDSNISTGTFLLAGTALNTECLNHTFEHIFIDVYNPTAPTSYGTIGYAVIGSEENTWFSTQTYAGTPILISSVSSLISDDYPSAYQTVLAAHSAGVNTFAGENSLITWDQKSANIVLFGANSTDFGNAYLSNVNVGTPGAAVEAIRVLGGTLEGLKGKLKIESKSSLLNIVSESTQITGWSLDCQFGAIVTSTESWIKFNFTSSFIGEFVNSNICINLYSITDPSFDNKAILFSLAARSELPIGKFANLQFYINRPLANIGVPWFPATMVGTSKNVTLNCLDATYTLVDRVTQRINLLQQFYLGLGTAAPSTIATIKLPNIVAGFSSRSGTLTIQGIIHNQNWLDGSSGVEEDITECPFVVANGFVSINTGSITVGAAGGDSFITPVSSAVSSNSASYLYTGAKLDLVYTAGTRTIAVNVGPKGTGPNIGAIFAFIDGVSIEMKTLGRFEESIYITV